MDEMLKSLLESIVPHQYDITSEEIRCIKKLAENDIVELVALGYSLGYARGVKSNGK